MRLFIAEKPSVAKAIAAELGQTGKSDGYIECGDTKVTWCFGHMLEQAEPDEYTSDAIPKNPNGKKMWRVEDLPIIPEKWILHPKDDAKKQLKVIGSLIKEADFIVNAGDPDREGNLLVDEVLEYFNNTKPVKRFWVSSIDSVTVKRGLSSLKENDDYKGWSDAARARARADWLIGMNLSRAYTLRAQRGGSRALLTVGRVQTPSLALVVGRDKEIEAFKPIPFHTIQINVVHGECSFNAQWQPQEDQLGLDAEGRMVDTAIANDLVDRFKNKDGQIAEYKQEPKKQAQPLAFALSDMTVVASSKFGYSAEEVLNTCQSLYETHKLTSYPRTDCAYLPEAQFDDAPAVLEAVKSVNPDLAPIVEGCDTSIKSRTWNDSKVTAHHGIVPTMHKGSKKNLTEMERNIYELVVRAFIAQFYPQHEYLSSTVLVSLEDETFAAKGKVITKNGWKDVYQDSEDDDSSNNESANQELPAIRKGDEIHCDNAIRKDSKTKPPARFTEGTLIRAMENIHKFVTDPAHKKLLREGDGIGTSATRASIISELKRREFLEVKGKKLISTTLGRSVIAALPEVVRSPVLTALYERMLKSIELKESDLSSFIAKQEAFILEQVTKANDGAVAIAGGKQAVPISKKHRCKSCDSGLSRRPTKKKGVFWWGCSNFPSCTVSYPDLKGLPDYTKQRDGTTKKTAN